MKRKTFSGNGLILILLSGCLLAVSCAKQPSLKLTGDSVQTITSTALNPRQTAFAPQARPDEIEDTPVARSAEPLRLTFPTPIQAPISAWRSPLYPVPWALGPHDHFYFIRPIAADRVNWPLANYRYGYVWPGGIAIHTGVDIDAPKDTPILAAGPGQVIWAGYGLYSGTNNPKDPYGQAVTIRHDFGYEGQQLYTIYAHMDKIIAIEGQRVETGTVIGLVGDTGNATGPHVHFEIRLIGDSYWTTRNPELWMAPPQGCGVLVGTFRNTNGSFLTQQDVKAISKATGQSWTVTTYGSTTVNSDDYYHENLVLADLPAGDFTIIVDYLDHRYYYDTTIHPGAITYISFQGNKGFNYALPATPSPEQVMGNPNP
ncbi:MAG TPA: M23 family metallopeptidase [Anaerolineaceae bacterium]|nr:M23 family metallopeptidase [Anaerolineaceae bacterium]